MSEKKCKMCGDRAEWEWDSELYCECCLCTEFAIHEAVPPRRCEQCGTPIKCSYFIDDDDENAFCSRECALEYYDARKIVEDGDNER